MTKKNIMSTVKVGDILSFNNGHRITVNSLSYDDKDVSGLPYLINEELWLTADGKTDPLSPKTAIVKAVITPDVEETVKTEETVKVKDSVKVEEMLSFEDLPAELQWTYKRTTVRKKGYTKYQKLIDFLDENSYRDFSMSELAVVWYRLSKQVRTHAQMYSILTQAVKVGLIKKTGTARYRSLKAC